MPSSLNSLTSEFGYTSYMISNANDYTGKATLTFLKKFFLINLGLKNEDVFRNDKGSYIVIQDFKIVNQAVIFQIIYRIKYFSYFL